MSVDEPVPIVQPTTSENAGYLATKRDKLGHLHLPPSPDFEPVS